MTVADSSVLHGRDRRCAGLSKCVHRRQLHQRPYKERAIYYHLSPVCILDACEPVQLLMSIPILTTLYTEMTCSNWQIVSLAYTRLPMQLRVRFVPHSPVLCSHLLDGRRYFHRQSRIDGHSCTECRSSLTIVIFWLNFFFVIYYFQSESGLYM